MAVTYYDLGHDRPLHQIVFAGTHDAGITSGADNAQTQNLEIYEQAAAGARIFDLRVAAHVIATRNGRKIYQMQTFHADPKLMRNSKGRAINVRTDERSKITKTSLTSGEWGISLSKVLQQARNFVIDNPSEFLLLKFDKCKNYPLIAEACIDILGPYIYQNGGNLNTKTLFDLAGSVIPMVPGKAARSLAYNYAHGIHTWRNLKSEDEPATAYKPRFNGLQYYGGGGTNPLKGGSFDDKIDENETTQRKRMFKMASAAANTPEVLGMMYWTTTGLFTNIQDRDRRQWEPQNRTRLAQLWQAGLGQSIESRLPRALVPESYSSAGMLKTFMPNFIMVDFISNDKGRYIKSLNTLAATQLTQQVVRQKALDQALAQIYGQ